MKEQNFPNSELMRKLLIRDNRVNNEWVRWFMSIVSFSQNLRDSHVMLYNGSHLAPTFYIHFELQVSPFREKITRVFRSRLIKFENQY